MTYPLENELEFNRLENQSLQPGYNLADELKDIRLQPQSRILDAGCGSGLLSRYLSKNYDVEQVYACDFSELRIAQAKKHTPEGSKIRYDCCSLTDLSIYESQSFDHVICRYVMEHTDQHHQILSEFKRVLKPGGTLILINFDGAFVNIYTKHEKLQKLMTKLIQHAELDLFIGRKLPVLCQESHFKDVKWDVRLVKFKSRDEMLDEKSNITHRCQFAMPLFENLFGKEDAEYFARTYLESLDSPETVLFYNKFIIEAKA